MQNEHSTAGHFAGDFEEQRFRDWVTQLRLQLSAPKISLGLVFMTPHHFARAEQILEMIRLIAQVPLLAGCSSTGLIAGKKEMENTPGIALGLFHLPGAKLEALYFKQEQVEEANGPAYWHLETKINSEQTNGWLTFADPFHLDCELWLRQWNEAYAPAAIVGGLASGDHQAQSTQIYLDGKAFSEGGVAVSFGGEVGLASVISQGCTPIGETWTITKTEQNIIVEIGNRRAYDVLFETLKNLPAEEQLRARENLFVGLVINEYLEEFHRGDFLIRNLMGVDSESGTIAIGAIPRVGQTMQFQRRDAATGTEDIETLLQRMRTKLSEEAVLGGCLCSCNGRGAGLFGVKDHDASQVQKYFGPMGLAGFFCNGEIGPVGERNFLHGYTASLALFVKK